MVEAFQAPPAKVGIFAVIIHSTPLFEKLSLDFGDMRNNSFSLVRTENMFDCFALLTKQVRYRRLETRRQSSRPGRSLREDRAP